MADAWEDKLAEAIAGELNDSARGWNSLFDAEETTAIRTRKPWYESHELEQLKVAVVPGDIDRTRVARPRAPKGREFKYTIFIDLQRLTDPVDDTKLKELSYAAEQIHDFFDDGHELTISGATEWICLEARRPVSYSPAVLKDSGTWETLIEVDVNGNRT